MGTGPQDLQALCQELLDACVDALDTIPAFAPALGGAPERRYISPGQSVDECCEQLTVWAAAVQPSPNTPSPSVGKAAVTGQINTVNLVVRIIRCVPTGESGQPPDTDDLQDAAAQINADGWALWNNLFWDVKSGLLFSVCGEVFWDGLRSITPSGGCGGWNLLLRVELDGYEPA